MMPRVITLYSDRPKQIQPKLSPEEQADILSLRDLLGNQHVSLYANDVLFIRHYVGFIARGKTRLQILPKVYAEAGSIDIEGEKSSSIKLLLQLLSYSGYLGYKNIPDPQSIDTCDNDLFEIFISIFATRFVDIYKRNVPRSYESYEENRQFIKGKILFHETILRNSFRKDKHYVRYDEFTENTLLNQLFKTVILHLLSQTTRSENKKNLNLALGFLEDVEPVRIYSGIFDKIVFNRMTEVYRPVFTIAKLLYYNKQPGFSEGDECTFTFLVPLNKLFEYYAYKLLDNYSFGTDITIRYQGPERYLAKQGNVNRFPLYPDIAIFNKERLLPISIVDAKFKNPFDSLGKIDLTSTDIYQVVTYAVCYQCQNVYLLYPHFKGQSVREPILAHYLIPTESSQIHLSILQIDIMDPDNSKIQQQFIASIGNLSQLVKPVLS